MNRAMRRAKHKLILLPAHIKTGLNFRMNSNQKKYSCICGSGWLSISMKEPHEAFQAHIESIRNPQQEGATA